MSEAGRGQRVLLINSDLLPFPGLPTTGSGLRCWGVAQALERKGHEVIISVPTIAIQGRETQVPAEVRDLAWTVQSLGAIIRETRPDVLVVCGWPTAAAVPPCPVPMALDQAGPHLLERHYQKYSDLAANIDNKLRGLARADFFTCCGEWQRLYFLPWLFQAGYDLDDQRIHAIAYSMPPELPTREPPVEPTLIYGGMFLPWQDPSVALTTVVETLEARGVGRMKFFGGVHPLYDVNPGVFPDLVKRLSQSRQFELFPVMAYDDLIEHYTRASVAVDLMKRNAEREVALTTRTVVYLWCGLPVIYNNYSELSRLIELYEAGWTVDPEDRAQIRQVIEQVLDQPEEVDRRGRNAQRLVRDRLTWDRTIGPLDAFCRQPSFRKEQESVPAWQPNAPPPPKRPGQLWREAAFHLRKGGPRQLAYYGLGFLAKQLEPGR